MSRLAFRPAVLAAMLAIVTTSVPAQVAGDAGEGAAARHKVAGDAGEGVAVRHKVAAAAPGRIEGSQEPVAVGAAITGIVEKVTVRQGDLVSAGDLLVRIACHDLEARLAARDAEHDAAEAHYRKLVNGARPEDVEIAHADLKAVEARLSEAQVRTIRSTTLFDRNAVSQAARDVDDRDVRMATALVDAARARLRLLKVGTREEEVAEAKARKIAAKHSVDVTKSELAKCEVKSPVAGIVLQKQVSEGELVTLFYPKPLVTISEIRTYRVRAEVDEHDVPRVRQGQNVEIVVNGSNPARLRGQVSSIAPVMGRRQILTSDPADKSDRDVMEVIVDLESRPDHLPIGLRVSAIFLE